MVMPVIKAPVMYVPGFIKDADASFATLSKELDWVRHDKVPRAEYYVNDVPAPYTYGDPKFARTYEPQPWHPLLREHQRMIEAHLGTRMEVCFLNMYKDGKDQLGWHEDDSPEMDPDRAIISVSLGAAREIWFRPNEAEAWRLVDDYYGDFQANEEMRKLLYLHFRKPQVLLMEHGSMVIMLPGMQKTWQHRIPKSHLNVCGPRISETWRGYVVPSPKKEAADE